MSHTAFGEFFPEIADKETRVLTVIDQTLTGLPLGAYALIDLYCTDLDCDCRNVFINIVHEGLKRHYHLVKDLINNKNQR